MGLLKLFSKPAAELLRLPSGSFTISREGNIVVGTIPSSYPAAELEEVARCVLSAFRGAAEAQIPLSELIIQYPAFKITARELRGGAVVFLTPESASTPANRK